jgi:hypothetical protein
MAGGSTTATYGATTTPGGAPTGGTTLNPDAGSGTDISPEDVSPADQQTIQAGTTWTPLAPALRDIDFAENDPAAKGKKGTDKDVRDPNLGRAADLLQIAGVFAHGAQTIDAKYKTLNPQALADLVKDLGNHPEASNFLNDLSGDTNATTAAGLASGKAQELSLLVAQAAYKAMVKSFNKAHIGLTPEQGQVPNTAKGVVDRIESVGSNATDVGLQAKLSLQGYAPGQIETLGDLVKIHSSLGTGAPGLGDKGAPGAPTYKPVTGQEWYDEMKSSYNAGGQKAAELAYNLNAIGRLDVTGGQPTDKDVADALQGVMKQAHADGVTPESWMGDRVANPAKYGLAPSSGSGTTIGDYYVEKIAQNIGVKLSAPAIQSIANRAAQSAQGTDVEAFVQLAVTQAAQQAVQNQGTGATIINGSMAQTIQENIRTAYAQMGVPLTPEQLASMTAATLQGGQTSSNYVAGEAATTTATAAARTHAGAMYPNLIPLLNEGQTVSGAAQPYLQTASNILGIPTAEMSPDDPQWMKWADGKNGLMSQSEWASYLQTLPQAQNAQPKVVGGQSAAQGILSALNMLPSNQTIPQAASSSGDLATT